MTTYASSIGNDNADYTTVTSWYSAQRQRTDFVNGDVVIGVLQNGVTDSHTGDHTASFGSTGSMWNSEKDLTVIISGTNPDRTATFGDHPVLNIDSFTYINAQNQHLTFKLENLDVSSDTRLRFQSDDVRDSSGIDVHFNDLRILQEGTGFFEDFTGDIRAVSAVSAAATTSEKLALIPPSNFFFTNCTHATVDESKDLWRHHPTDYDHFKTQIDVVGCTFRMRRSSGQVFDPERGTDSKVVQFQFNVSGSMYDTSAGEEFVNFSENGILGHTYGNVVDFISNELSTEFDNWALPASTTNYSATTFVYGSAPAAGQVAFSADGLGTTYPDFRLYDDSNNIAIGHVQNVTLPSPDLAGNDRGVSPFDAGPFEFIDSGGADVTAAFGNVYVRLY